MDNFLDGLLPEFIYDEVIDELFEDFEPTPGQFISVQRNPPPPGIPCIVLGLCNRKNRCGSCGFPSDKV